MSVRVLKKPLPFRKRFDIDLNDFRFYFRQISLTIGTEDEQEKNKLQDGPFDPYGLIRKNVAEGKKIPPVYFSCGMQDMLWEKVCHYEKFMEENGVDVTWVPVDGFRHEWRFWNLQIEKFLEWIARTDAYAADQKQHRSV